MAKKAQITIFILLGIVFLTIMAFLFYIRARSSTAVNQENIDQAIDSMLAKAPINMYVEACLEKATEDGIVLIGRQGGKIFDFQIKGTARFLDLTNTLRFIQDNTVYNVGYGILKSNENIPYYPYSGSLTPEDRSSAFGRSGLIELCDNEGVNTWNLPNAQYSCIQYDPLGSEHSIQEYLEKYIANKTKECVDIESLTADLGYDISEGVISSQVLFGDTDIIATVDYEIIIAANDKSTHTRLLQFSFNPEVRIKKMYELAFYLIEEEINNIFFDMSDINDLAGLTKCPSADRTSFTEQCLRPGMQVRQSRDVCPSCPGAEFSDIVQITDQGSIIDGVPLIFQFAVRNRAPALDFIDESVDGTYPYYWYMYHTYGSNSIPSQIYQKTSTCPDCNIAVPAGQDIEIYPHAIDPDGDQLQYSYFEWKGLLWEESPLYQTSKKDARLPTASPIDVGMHKVLVIATDNQGLYDYQNLTILVQAP